MTIFEDDSKIALSWQHRIQTHLEQVLPDVDTEPTHLHKAMRYSVLNGGKRIRPMLVYASSEIFGTPVAAADAIACSIELIHAYSLIHDDLPAMDNDELRRGQPTTHIQFDEATAILAGDALQSLAFKLLAQCGQHPQVQAQSVIEMIVLLGDATGSTGMAGGQILDLFAAQSRITPEACYRMHAMKTGALISAAIMLPLACSQEKTRAYFSSIQSFSTEIGVAFQIQDDILDVIGDTSQLGKRQGADDARGKQTFPAVFGLEGAQAMVREHLDKALSYLRECDLDTTLLQSLASYMVERNH